MDSLRLSVVSTKRNHVHKGLYFKHRSPRVLQCADLDQNIVSVTTFRYRPPIPIYVEIRIAVSQVKREETYLEKLELLRYISISHSFCVAAKSACRFYHARSSLCPHVRIRTAPLRQISVTFDTRDFYENLLRTSKFAMC